MKVIEVEGRTVDDATKKAIAELGITDSSKINIEVIDEGKSGIFGFGVSRPAKIRLFYNIDTKDIADTIRDVIENVFRRMEIDCRIADVKEGESKVYIELESKNSSGLVIGRKGKTLEALQFMVNLIVTIRPAAIKK